MKKVFLIIIALIQVLFACACDSRHHSDNESNGGNYFGTKDITWSDYRVSAVNNLTYVYFGGKEGLKEADSKEQKAKIIVEPLCPYCHCDRWCDVIEFDELPTDELGNQTILFETTTVCLDWDKHWDTREFNISILLTLDNQKTNR